MPKSTTSGAAAPRDNAPESTADEISQDIMAEATRKLGVRYNLPAKPAAQADDDEAEETTGTDGQEAAGAKKGPEADDESQAEGDDVDAQDDGEAADTDDNAEEAENEEAETDEDGEDEGTEESEDKGEQDVDLRSLPDAQRKKVQAIIDRRIGRMTAKAKEKEEQLTGRVSELEGQLAEAQNQRGPVVLPGVHPLLTAESETEIDKRLQQIEAFEDWADQYRDGYEGDGTKADPSWSAEQIRARARELSRERERIIPQARAVLKERGRIAGIVKQVYPAVFDRKTPEYASAQRMLQTMPELRRHADRDMIIAQQILGAKAFADLFEQTKGPKQSTAAAPKKAPRVPGRGSPAKGSVVQHQRHQSDVSSAVKSVAKNPTRSGLAAVAQQFLD